MEAFDLDHLERTVRKLPSHRHRLAFGAGIAERLLPNYDAFSREEGWGDQEVLRSALDLVWRIVEGETAPLMEIRQLQDGISVVTPDTDNPFDSLLTSAALDACGAVDDLLEACVEDDPRRIAVVASLARDTVDLYVQHRDQMNPSDPLRERRILADPLMIRELEKQHAEIELLSNSPLDLEFVRRYRENARYAGKSILDIP